MKFQMIASIFYKIIKKLLKTFQFLKKHFAENEDQDQFQIKAKNYRNKVNKIIILIVNQRQF